MGAGPRSRLVRRVRDPRDAAVARLPRVLVAPRVGFEVVGADVLDLPDHLAAVSSSAARTGNYELIAPECRPIG